MAAVPDERPQALKPPKLMRLVVAQPDARHVNLDQLDYVCECRRKIENSHLGHPLFVAAATASF